MSYKCCEDCGCKIYGGICSNCQEELFIIENQSEFIYTPLSDDFLEKAKKQRRTLNEQR